MCPETGAKRFYNIPGAGFVRCIKRRSFLMRERRRSAHSRRENNYPDKNENKFTRIYLSGGWETRKSNRTRIKIGIQHFFRTDRV